MRCKKPPSHKSFTQELPAQLRTVSSKLVNLTFSKQRVYTRKSLGAICPVHNRTHMTAMMAGNGIQFACGCIWMSGGGSLEGWFRHEDRS